MNDELKQFRDGVAMGRSFGVPPAMLFGYWWGYWMNTIEKAVESWQS